MRQRRWIILLAVLVASVQLVGQDQPRQAIPQRSSDDSAFLRGKRFAVVVGISRYLDFQIRLRYSTQDAEAIAQALQTQGYEVTTLLNEQATRARIEYTLSELRGRVGPEDTILFFFSGQGSRVPLESDPRTGRTVRAERCLLTFDSYAQDTKTTGIPLDELTVSLRNSNAGAKALFLDAGFRDLEPEHGLASDVRKVFQDGNGAAVISFRPDGDDFDDRSAYESASLGHGIFSEAIIRGLQGEADESQDGNVSIEELAHYLRIQVALHSRRRQIVDFESSGSDFLLAMTRLSQPDRFRGIDPAPDPRRPTPAVGRSFVLAIGINAYDKLPPLTTAVNDAEAVSLLLESNFRVERPEVLRNATRDQIAAALNRYRQKLTPADSLLIYYAGHGLNDEGTDRAYWLPVDADKDDNTHWYSNDDISSLLRAIKAAHILVISDSCYSGKMTSDAPVDSNGGDLEKLTQMRSRSLLSSGGNEPVTDGNGDGRHSAFATALMEALAQFKAEKFSAEELFSGAQLVRRVALKQVRQTPHYRPILEAGDGGGVFVFERKGN